MQKDMHGDANGLLSAIFVVNAARRQAATYSQFQWMAGGIVSELSHFLVINNDLLYFLNINSMI
jgi:hypothetical protein